MLFCIQPVRHADIDSDLVERLTIASCPGLRLSFFSRPFRRRRRRRYIYGQKQEPVMAAAPVDAHASSRCSLDQPPPAYESASTSNNGRHKSRPLQEYLHMTTTQTVTLTTQMILPLRRSMTMAKRELQLDRPVQTDTQRPPQATLMLNKDLPPPPADEPDIHTSQTQAESLAPPVPLPATFALAHAALGLGLPSALPQPPRVSISSLPAGPTIQFANDLESDKGPLIRSKAERTTNGATLETPRQRTRFISLGVRPTAAPGTTSNEPRLSASAHESISPRASNNAFGKKVRRAKSFTDRLKSAVGSQ